MAVPPPPVDEELARLLTLQERLSETNTRRSPRHARGEVKKRTPLCVSRVSAEGRKSHHRLCLAPSYQYKYNTSRQLSWKGGEPGGGKGPCSRH